MLFKKLIALRKQHKVICYGVVQITNQKKNLFTYYRMDETETLYIEINLSSSVKKRKKYPKGIRLLSNYTEGSVPFLRPYEANIWKCE